MINTEISALFDEWKKAMQENGDKGFCYDGLIYRDGREDSLWKQSKRRIVFLLKEQNDNDGEDVREWSGSINGVTPNGNFFHRLSAWIFGLSHLTSHSYPSREEAFSTQNQMKVLKEYPYAYVNVKKESGGATANDSVVYNHAVRYSSFIRRELDILNPNIIVCGGDIVFKAAVDSIYKDLHFEQLGAGGWVHYCKSKNIFLINSFHPTAKKSNEVMYDWMMKDFMGVEI